MRKCYLQGYGDIAEKMPILSPCWNMFLWLVFRLFLLLCCCSVTTSCPTLCDPRNAAHQAPLSFNTSCNLLKLMSIESVMSSSHLILCRPLLLLPSISPSNRVFSSELALRMRWPNYCSFNFSHSPSNEVQDWFPWWGTGSVFLQSKGLSRVFSSTIWKP